MDRKEKIEKAKELIYELEGMIIDIEFFRTNNKEIAMNGLWDAASALQEVADDLMNEWNLKYVGRILELVEKK